jgi:hypothetical protein
MGFDREWSQQAALAVNSSSAEAATEWLLSQKDRLMSNEDERLLPKIIQAAIREEVELLKAQEADRGAALQRRADQIGLLPANAGSAEKASRYHPPPPPPPMKPPPPSSAQSQLVQGGGTEPCSSNTTPVFTTLLPPQHPPDASAGVVVATPAAPAVAPSQVASAAPPAQALSTQAPSDTCSEDLLFAPLVDWLRSTNELLQRYILHHSYIVDHILYIVIPHLHFTTTKRHTPAY